MDGRLIFLHCCKFVFTNVGTEHEGLSPLLDLGPEGKLVCVGKSARTLT